MGGQLIEPCGKLAVAPEVGQAFPSREKGVLCRLVGVRLIAAHAQRQPEYLIPVGIHQLFESGGITLLRTGNGHVQFFHCKSLLIPAVTRYTSSMVFIRTI